MSYRKAFIAIVLALSIVAALFLGGAFIDTTARDTISIAITGTAQAYTADMVCDGIDDHVQWQEAVDNLPSGGKVQDLCGVQYNFGDVVTLPNDGITIEGLGAATNFTRNDSDPLFSDGGYSDCLFINLSTDSGGVTISGNDSYIISCWIGDSYTSDQINIDLLNDTDLTGLADDDVLQYDLATLTWKPEAAGGGTFLSLTDTPASYTGYGSKWLKVNAAETAVEFTRDVGDSGTSFPASPVDAQRFYRTDLDCVFTYESDWKPIISFGSMDVYVSSTGDDSDDGYSSGAAKATLDEAWACVPPLFGGDTYVHVDGTISYDGTLSGKFPTGGYRVYIIGDEAASYEEQFVASSINALGWVTKVGQFAGDSYRGYILKNVTNDWETLILKHTDDVVTVVGDLWGTAAVGDTWEINSFGGGFTTNSAAGLKCENDYTTFQRLKFSASGGTTKLTLDGRFNDATTVNVDSSTGTQGIQCRYGSSILRDVYVSGATTGFGLLGYYNASVDIGRVGVYNCKNAIALRTKTDITLNDVCRIDCNDIVVSSGFNIYNHCYLGVNSAATGSIINNVGTGWKVYYFSRVYKGSRVTNSDWNDAATAVDTATANGIYTP